MEEFSPRTWFVVSQLQSEYETFKFLTEFENKVITKWCLNIKYCGNKRT